MLVFNATDMIDINIFKSGGRSKVRCVRVVSAWGCLSSCWIEYQIHLGLLISDKLSA